MSSLFSVATATAFGGHQLRGGGYKIQRSVRLRSSASAYLSRTFGTATNSTIYTFSTWAKRGELGTIKPIVQGYLNNNNYGHIIFKADNTIEWRELAAAVNYGQISTNAVFRDPSSWYHIVVVRNGTSLTIYVNGVSQTLTVSTAVNAAPGYLFGTSTAQRIGSDQVNTAYFDGYMAEVNFIDGQALTPASFGKTNTYTGVWSPIRYSGSYGNNGFYLNFSDNSAATAAAIGKDYSGLDNNWTPNNISVTAGATYDSMLDVPTLYADGGNGRGNYCTLNPLAKDADVTLSNGNLDFSCTSAGLGGAIGTIAVSSGKWYWEVTVTGGTASAVGIAKLPLSAYDANQTGTYLYLLSGDKRLSPSTDSAYGASYTTNDVIGVALDMDAGTVAFYKNNSSQGTAFSSLSGDFTAWMQDGTSGSASSFVANFGQRPFQYSVPAGFKALNTQNLP